MNEIWKDIEGYEGLYQVSNLGRVKSLPRKGTFERIIMPGTKAGGYLCVALYKDGKVKYYRVNRLVAEAFIPNPDNKPQCNHINEDVTDNRACNLNWMSSKENINWGTGILRSHQKQVNHPNMSKPVKQLSLDGALIAIWPSTMEAGRNGFDNSNICKCCNGKYAQYKGYKWEWVC